MTYLDIFSKDFVKTIPNETTTVSPKVIVVHPPFQSSYPMLIALIYPQTLGLFIESVEAL
jgi:hypothetical protein